MTAWHRLLRELARTSPGGVNPSSADAVAKYETATGRALPRSYREMVTTLGPGLVGDYFRVFAPGFNSSAEGDLAAFQRSVDAARTTLEEVYRESQLIRRLIPFADTIGGDLIAWDPSVVTDREASEYLIYALPDDQTRVVKLGPSFSTFLEDVCLGEGFKQLFSAPGWSPPRKFETFRPAEGTWPSARPKRRGAGKKTSRGLPPKKHRRR